MASRGGNHETGDFVVLLDGGSDRTRIFPGSRPKMLISQTVVELAAKEGRDRVAKFIDEFAKSP